MLWSGGFLSWGILGLICLFSWCAVFPVRAPVGVVILATYVAYYRLVCSRHLLSKEELRHLHIDIRSLGGDRYRDILLTLYCDPDVLRIGALSPGITR